MGSFTITLAGRWLGCVGDGRLRWARLMGEFTNDCSADWGFQSRFLCFPVSLPPGLTPVPSLGTLRMFLPLAESPSTQIHPHSHLPCLGCHHASLILLKSPLKKGVAFLFFFFSVSSSPSSSWPNALQIITAQWTLRKRDISEAVCLEGHEGEWASFSETKETCSVTGMQLTIVPAGRRSTRQRTWTVYTESAWPLPSGTWREELEKVVL